MKKQIIILALTLAAIGVYAQTSTNKRFTVDKNSIVQDSSGMKYPYFAWQKMVAGGDYGLKPLNPQDENPIFVITKLSPEQKASRLSHLLKPRESEFFTTGETIKPFKAKDINGNKFDAKAWAGKTVVLNFWFIGCSPCRQEMPELNKIVAKYAGNPNVIFLGIALDRDYDVGEFIKKTPFNYALIGDGRYYADLFNIHSFPTNVVISKTGKVLFHSSGYTLNTPLWIDKTIAESDSATAATP